MQLLKKGAFFLWKHKVKLVVLAAAVGGGLYYQNTRSNGSGSDALKVKTAIVEKTDIEVMVSGSGQVEAESQVDLQPQVAGDGLDVTKVLVKNDQEIAEGDVIAILDSEDAVEKIRDARLALQSAQIQQKQTEKKNDTKTEDDKWIRQLQEISVNQKTINLSDANKELEEYYIKAPFDGIVTGLSVEAGDSISRTETLASVITKEMIANISLNEIDAVKVQNGAVAKLTFSALDGVEVEGVVSKIDTIGEVSSGVVSYNAEISFDASEVADLKPGMSTEAEIVVSSKKDVLAVPVSSVQETPRGDQMVVIVPAKTSSEQLMQMMKDHAASGERGLPESFKRVSVETGVSDDVFIEIKGDVVEGDVVLTQSISSILSSLDSGNSGTGNSKESAGKSIMPTMGRGMGGGKRPGR